MAISMVASMAALGMALDLGRLYFVHRELQLVADMAALDAARSAGGCLGRTDDPQGAAAGEAASSLQRNGASLNYLTSGSVEIGRQIVADGVRAFVPDSSVEADSVRVTLRRPLPSRLIPILAGNSSGVLSVSAAAALRPIVSIDVGSGLLDIGPGGSLGFISGALGSPGLLDVASYNGLLSVNVELGDLALAANAGSVQDFLDTEITAPGLLDALGNALGNGTDAAARASLEALASGASTSRRVVPRDVLGVPAGSTSDQALVNAGALVTSVAEAANGDNLITLTQDLDLPPLLSGNVSIRLIELARPAIGPPITDPAGSPATVANTAQAAIQAVLGVGGIPGTRVQLPIYARLAEASAGVVDLRCSQRGRPYPIVTIESRSGVGRIGVGVLRDPLGEPDWAEVTRVGGVRILARANADLDDDQRRMTFEGPFPAQPQYLGTDPGEALARAIEQLATDIQIRTEPAVLDGVTRAIVQPVLDQLEPQLAEALRQANTSVLEPLLTEMGVNTGSARVQVRSVVAQQPEVYVR